jgi:hypothetical protein
MELANLNSDIVHQIKSIIEQARQKVAVAVNHELLRSYWQIGKLIVDCGQTTKNWDSQIIPRICVKA